MRPATGAIVGAALGAALGSKLFGSLGAALCSVAGLYAGSQVAWHLELLRRRAAAPDASTSRVTARAGGGEQIPTQAQATVAQPPKRDERQSRGPGLVIPFGGTPA